MPRWSFILMIWMLVFAAVRTRAPYPLTRTVLLIGSNDLVSFRNPNVSFYSNLLVRNGWLYATGTSHVLRLSAGRIDDRTKNAFNYINTTTSKTNETDSKRNFITFLSPRPRLNDLVICGTNLGKPHIYDLSEADLSYQFEHDGSYLCPGLEGFASLGLIGHESQLGKRQMIGHGVMFSAIWITDEPSDKYSIFSRYGIFRKNMEVNDQFARTLFSPSWLWEPEFVSIMEDDSFVYFLFNEVSIEEFSLKYTNFSLKSIQQIADTPQKELKRVPRIARICKNDKAYSDRTRPYLSNMWTTFRKVKLQCDCRGLFETPELKHLEERDFDELSAALELPHSKRLIGVFHDNDTTRHSAICEFGIEDVRGALSSNKFWLSADHANLNEENFKYYLNDISCDSDDGSEQDLTKEVDDESLNPARTDQSFAKISRAFPTLSKEDVNGYYDFLAENTILNRVVQGQCKFILPHEIISISLNENTTAGKTDIFLASSSKRIIKFVRNSGNGSSFYEYQLDLNLNISTTGSDEPNPTTILFSQKTNSLYVADKDAIHQLKFDLLAAKMCSAYKTCQDCARDDNCAWTKRASKCAEKKSRSTPGEPCGGAELSASPASTREVSGFVNETLVLKCATRTITNELDESIVQRSLFWIRDGKSLEADSRRRIVSRQSELVIVKLEASDQGLYQCKSRLVDISNEGAIRVRVLERAPFECPNDIAQRHSDLVRLVSMIKVLSEKIKELNGRLKTLDCS